MNSPAKIEPPKLELNPDQSKAVDEMVEFLKDPSLHYFLLRGSAGTGKTFCIRALADRVRSRFIYTAPTNKATKVIRESLTREDYRPECCTIYSLLGLKIAANGEVKELTKPDIELDLSLYGAIIVDEASMINSALVSYIQEAAETQNLKFIFMGDAAQLPPVGEAYTKVWDIADRTSELQKVMRYDNQILTLATHLRNQVSHPAPTFPRKTDNANGEGVWACESREFLDRILDAAGQGRFSQPNEAQAIAWRNVTVDSLNQLIRRRIFQESASNFWLSEDRVFLMEPANDLEGDKIASTDDEGKILRIDEDSHPLYPEFQIWRISVTLDDNRTIALRALHPNSKVDYDLYTEELAAEARREKRKWKQFWEFKEAFHSVRHAYAKTAHRMQGSTVTAAFVDWRDILLNRNRSEAFRCLYVACTRAKKELYLGG